MNSILLVDDDKSLLEIYETYLIYKGYEVRLAESIRKAVSTLSEFTPSCVVLDMMLPDGNSIDTFERLKKLANCPIIMLSSTTNEEKIVSGLCAGADDFITKPVSPKILELKIAVRIRDYLQKSKTARVCEFSGLTIDAPSKEARFNGELIDLTAKEFSILLFLSRNVNVSYELNDIYTAVWGMYHNGNPLTVQSHVSNLKKKLRVATGGREYIKTSWGNGYKFCPPE